MIEMNSMDKMTLRERLADKLDMTKAVYELFVTVWKDAGRVEAQLARVYQMLEESRRDEAELLTAIRAVVDDAIPHTASFGERLWGPLTEHHGFFVNGHVFKQLAKCLPVEDRDGQRCD